MCKLELLQNLYLLLQLLNPLCSKLLNPLLLRTCVLFLLQLLPWLFLRLFSMLSIVRLRRCTMLFAGIAFFGLRASTCSAALSARGHVLVNLPDPLLVVHLIVLLHADAELFVHLGSTAGAVRLS